MAEDLADRLDRWVRLELITDEQARRIRAAETGAEDEPAPRAVSPVVEVLGYVGGVLVLVAAVILAGRYWPAIPAGSRVTIALVAAALLLGIGIAVPQTHDAGRRLRAVTWTLSVLALGFGVALLTDEVLDLGSRAQVLLTSVVCAAYAGVLWWRLKVALLHLALIGCLVLATGSAAAMLPGDDGAVAGLAVWGAGVVWLLLSWGGLVPPWQAADVAGSLAMIVGSMVALDESWGPAPALLTIVGLLGAGVTVRDLWLTGGGTVATLILVPMLSQKWFPDSVAAPVTLLLAGTLLVIGAVVVARRGGRRAFGHRRTGPPRTAAAAAAAAVGGLGIAAVVVALGL